jgi:hypothetical protein
MSLGMAVLLPRDSDYFVYDSTAIAKYQLYLVASGRDISLILADGLRQNIRAKHAPNKA